MNTSKAIALVAATAAIEAVAFIAFIKITGNEVATAEEPKPAVEQKVKRSSEDAMQIRNLRNRVRDLEKQLAAAGKQVEDEPTTEEKRPEPPRDEKGFASQMQKHFEDMKKNDPERYANMTNAIANGRKMMRNQSAQRLDILASVFTASMTPEQLAVHEKYQQLLIRQNEIRETLMSIDSDVSIEDRMKAMGEMRDLMGEMHTTGEQERDILLSKTAEAAGLSGDDATALVNTIKDVYEATGNSRGGFGPPPGMGPGGPGGPGGRR